jgi:hypothetical protein
MEISHLQINQDLNPPKISLLGGFRPKLQHKISMKLKAPQASHQNPEELVDTLKQKIVKMMNHLSSAF